MKLLPRIVLIAVLAGAGFWLWTVLFPSPEKAVLKKIASLAANANISASEGNISRAAKATSVVGEFANDAEVVFDMPNAGTHTLSGREEIREAALGGFANVPWLKVEFLDARAKVGPDQQTAEVTCTARATAGDSRDIGIQELHFQLKKTDRDWLITRVDTVKTLQ